MQNARDFQTRRHRAAGVDAATTHGGGATHGIAIGVARPNRDAGPGSRHVARWETLELAQSALLEYAATTRRPAEQYGVQSQVEAVEYAEQRRRDYHRKRPYEIEGVDTGGD